MRSVYLLSGSREKIFEDEFLSNLKKEMKDDSNFCFIAANFNQIEKNKDRFCNILNMFKIKNIEFNEKYLIDDSTSKEDIENYIKKSDIIFLMGGNTLAQISSLKEKEIIKMLRSKDAIFIGLSAGSINMGKNIVLTKDVEDDIPETICYEGIGFSNINVEPHCDFENEEHWKDLLDASNIDKIVCMKENCFIHIKDSVATYYGDYCIIENGKIILDNR